MKTGKTIVELAKQLEEIQKNAMDCVAPTSVISMTENATILLQENETDYKTYNKRFEFKPNKYSHGQIASYTGVPKQYYDKLLTEKPALLADNVNHGLKKQANDFGRGGKTEARLIRTYKKELRALLSSSYRRLDSYDLLQTILPDLISNNFEVASSEITDTRMYLKVLTPKVKAEIKKGDVVQFGLVISNSDVGAGSFRVEPLIFRLICQNGMISNTAIKKFHIGKNMAGDDIQELLTSSTLELSDQAFFAQVRDVVMASMKPQMFELEVNRLREAAKIPIKNFDIPAVVELSMKAVGVDGENTKQNIIQYLANGADGAGLTKWGLANGFTYAAQQDEVNYDDSVSLERAGAKIIDLSPTAWKRVAE